MPRTCRPLVLLVAAVLAMLAAGCGGSAAPLPSAAPRYLADCSGHPQPRPTMVVVRCADVSMTARNLKWAGWGARVATATGTAVINDCEFQDCHTGLYSAHPVVLVISGAVACPTGGRAYARIQVMFVGRFITWPRADVDQIVSRPCGGSGPPTPAQQPTSSP
jgi:hypothetical protein